MNNSAQALAAKQALANGFRKKGIAIAVLSGMLYGIYTAFMTQGMASGKWAAWYGGAASAFAVIYTLSAVGAATNDLFSAVWTLIYSAIKGKLGDFGRSLKSKPGVILIISAIISDIYICHILHLRVTPRAITDYHIIALSTITSNNNYLYNRLLARICYNYAHIYLNK